MSDGELHWFVAYVTSHDHEAKVAESISMMGLEAYYPVRREVHKWSDRKKVVNVRLIPRIVFVRCSEKDRIRSLKESFGRFTYLRDRATKRPAVVRDREMATFRAMVDDGVSRVEFRPEGLAPGDRVRVLTGTLKGHECEVVNLGGNRLLVVRLGTLGSVTMDLATEMVEKIV